MRGAKLLPRRAGYLALVGVSTLALAAPTVAAPQDAEVSPEAAVEIREVKPDRAEAGAEVTVAIEGAHFARGAYVSFSHPAVRVLATKRMSDTRLEVKLAIGARAPGGPLTLYVSNSAGPVAAARFTITGGAAPGAPTQESTLPSASEPPAEPPRAETEAAPPAQDSAAAPAPAATALSAEPRRFEVFNLGEGVSILQDLNKPRGTLRVSEGKLKYEESGKEVFTAAPAEIREMDANLIFGVNTGTFHVILASGKTFNFVATSLQPADSQAIVETLRRALK